ncbi:MAG: hypothetical protein SGI98_06455 [Verrucomicrobiota bacterium]|nr:hypothetical protein [Verrucomicrobiota bacterium]
MDVQTAVLCDSAADYGGKLCVLGAFDTIWARQFPAVHPFCSVAIRVVFRDVDAGKHNMKIQMIDDDGRNLVPPIEGEINIQLPENVFFLSQNFVLNLQQFKIDQAGQYSVDVSMDKHIIARIPLQVIKVDQIPPFHHPPKDSGFE